MPTEIADSDAESDFGSPRKPDVTPDENNDASDSPSCSLSKMVNFDEFLDPTQRLSSFDASRNESEENGTGSTERLLGEIADAQQDLRFSTSAEAPQSRSTGSPGVARSAKRAHSALADASRNDYHSEVEQIHQVKRAKSVVSTSNFGEVVYDPLPIAASSDFAMPASLELLQTEIFAPHGEPLNTQAANSARTLPMGHFTSVPVTMRQTSHAFTTTNASMGGYQSINLDFRGTGSGLDIDANPFASLSQASTDDAHEAQEEGEKGAADGAVTLPALYPEPPIPASLQLPEVETHALLGVSVHPNRACDAGPAEPAPENQVAKKRGRKPKAPRPTSNTPGPQRDNSGGNQISSNALESDRRSRAGTIDSVSQASVTSSVTSTTKRKRKRTVDRDLHSDQDLHPNQPPNELQFSEEALIGLPKENYKPRPSRSRSKKLIEDENILAPSAAVGSTNAPSSKKNITNGEDHTLSNNEEGPILGDARSREEANNVKELIKTGGPSSPPSKTKRKKAQIVDDEDELALYGKKAETSNQSLPSEMANNQPPTPPKATTKRGRKSKVKRAKTSAAALLKTQPMLSDGDEDVVWMDSKPAPVTLDLPSAIIMPKHNKDEKGEEDRNRDQKFTIEIPPLRSETFSPKPSPTKREQDSRTLQIMSKLEEPDVGATAAQLAVSKSSRPPLANKSVNLPAAVDQRDPKAPTVSPLSSPETEDIDPRQNSKFDQSKPAKAAISPSPLITTVSPEKSAATHSPLSKSRAIYRVGLSKSQKIPSLLRKVNRDKAAPKVVAPKETAREKKLREAREANGEEGEAEGGYDMRGEDGYLVEWGD